MRILCLSDSHKRGDIADRIIAEQPTAKDIFFLGDLTRDIEDLQYIYTDRTFHIVSGNCDFCSEYPNTGLANVGGVNILYTHGHTYGVKYGTERLLEAARTRNCKIALYGHTHVANTDYENGIYIVNPGSCSSSREGPNSYAVIDIEKNGIMPIIVRL